MSTGSGPALERVQRLPDYPTAPWMRIVVIALTIVVGLSGLSWARSNNFGENPTLLLLITATTVPTALFVYVYGRRISFVIPFIIWADVAITIVLLAGETHFDSMPGVAMIIMVSMFAAVFTRTWVMLSQLGLVIALLLVTGALAVSEGTDIWLVITRILVLLSIGLMPILLKLHVDYLTEKIETSRRDTVTGLLNRRGLDDAVSLVPRPRTPAPTMGVILVQLHDFDTIERRLGRHASADLVTEVTDLLRDIAPHALIGRTQTSEFACVVVGSSESVRRDLGSLVMGVEGARLRSAAVRFTCSTATTLITGRNPMTVYLGRALTSAAFDQYNLARPARFECPHITALIESGGPEIVFQPILSVSTGKVLGYEALSRFPAGHGSTQTWFLDAKAAGLQVELEMSSISRAVAASLELDEGVFVSINASATTILARDLVPVLLPAADRRPVALEITEHDLVSDYSALSSALEDLRTAGMSISVDDVGAGYSGLRQLVEIKPDVIKIDASIVRGIDEDDMRRAAATALTDFAGAIGAQCIYEGIETRQELDTARALGADMVQGFLLGKPMSIPV